MFESVWNQLAISKFAKHRHLIATGETVEQGVAAISGGNLQRGIAIMMIWAEGHPAPISSTLRGGAPQGASDMLNALSFLVA
jgi:hypothetical protein